MNHTPPRDPHLLAALAHAPDRDVQAPAQLTQRLALQARAALQGQQQAPVPLQRPRTAPAAPWWSTLQRWFSPPRATGALATVMLAGVIGLMWQGGLPPEALPGAESAAPDPVQTPPSSPSQPTASPIPIPTPPAQAQAQAQADEGAGGAKPTLAAKRSATAPVTAAPADGAGAPAALPAPVAQAPAAPAQEASDQPAPVARLRAGAAAGPADLAVDEAAVRPAPAAPAAAAAPAAPAAAAAAVSEPAAPARPRPAAAAPTAQVVAPSATPALVQPLQRGAQRGEPAADPLSAALAAWADAPSDPPQLQTLRAQLASLQAAARGRWRPAAPLPSGVGQPVLDAQGQTLGRLLVQDRRVVWQDASGTWQAELPLPAAQAPASSAR